MIRKGESYDPGTSARGKPGRRDRRKIATNVDEEKD